MVEPRVLTTDDIEVIAEKAAEKALQKVYAEVGQSVIKKALWAAGAAALAVSAWVTHNLGN